MKGSPASAVHLAREHSVISGMIWLRTLSSKSNSASTQQQQSRNLCRLDLEPSSTVELVHGYD